MKVCMKITYFLANCGNGIFNSVAIRLLHYHSSVEQLLLFKLAHACRRTKIQQPLCLGI